MSAIARRARITLEEIDRQHIFTIALIIIISYIVIFAVTHILDMLFPREDRFQGIKELNNTLGAVVLVIVGFYFGRGPTTQLSKKVEEATKDSATKEEVIKDLLAKNDKLEKQLQRTNEVVEMVKTEFEPT